MRIAWNKGLTKENDKRVAKFAKAKIGKKRPDISERYKGKGNPHYKNGIRTGKRVMLEFYNICEICDSEKNLEIHHKDGNRLNNDLENLQLLCRSCHSKQHRGKEWHSQIIKFRSFNNGRKI